jgi:CHAT domain-containing protein
MGTRFFWALGEASRQKANWTAAADSFRQSIAIGSPGVRSLATPEAGLVRLVEESYRGLVAATLAAPGAENAAYDTWRAYQSLDNSGAPARSSAPLLSFVELPDGLVAWLGQDGGSSFHRIAATRDEFAAVANRFLRECSDPAVPSGQLRADARRLYDWMIAPFADRLPAGRVLAVALDRGFGAIPVQALLAPDGRYLAERDPILVFTGYGEQPATPARDAAALIVANPAVAGASAARFPPLPDSTAEANAVRAAFPASRVLEGSGATLDALARALPEASIVHFAGHGYTGSENGAILLAPRDPAAADYDLLRFSELRRLPWSQCRLAVLSACATAAGETRGPHNPQSLVRALIKGGAARVAASLWNVDSAATSALMQQFYSALASGADVPAAMRIAQDAVRRRPEWAHPYYWAGFQLYGKT